MNEQIKVGHEVKSIHYKEWGIGTVIKVMHLPLEGTWIQAKWNDDKTRVSRPRDLIFYCPACGM